MRGDAFYNNAFNVNADKVVNNSLDNNIFWASWYNYYRVIKQANAVIKFTPQVLEAGGISAEKADDVMGQAYCLRAFTYFWIIRIWGDAPLVTAPYLDSNDSFDLPKAAVADIVEQIHSDLENASNMIDKNSKHWYKPANMHKSLIPDAVKNRFLNWQAMLPMEMTKRI